jgi:hypothetical protein
MGAGAPNVNQRFQLPPLLNLHATIAGFTLKNGLISRRNYAIGALNPLYA